jgi:hypothetical protein
MDNMRLVCVAVNFGMGQWGEEVFLTLARAAADHEKRERLEPANGSRCLESRIQGAYCRR